MTDGLGPLFGALAELTRPNLLELSRRLGIARNTVQARLERLQRDGVISGYGPVVQLDALGLRVLAFMTLEIAQGRESAAIDALTAIPEVLEVHKITGPGDLLCRVVASSNEHLHTVIEAVLASPGVVRTTTALALHTAVNQMTPSAVAAAALSATPSSRD
jgi:DNA-binding Lrp family transcriptional regulator